jgi:hypothetical protein
MRDLLILAIHVIVTLAKLHQPGGGRAVAAESLLLKHQLVIINRTRQRAPNLTSFDRVVLGLTTLFVSPRRLAKLSAIFKPATLFRFHKTLVDRKYTALFIFGSLLQTRSERSYCRYYRGHRRDETPQSSVRLYAHRPAGLACLRYQYR